MITDAQLRGSEVEPFGAEERVTSSSVSDPVNSSGTNPFSGRERFSEGEPSFLEADQRTPGKPINVTAVPYQTNRDARTTLYVTWTNQPAAGKVITGVEVEQSTTGNDNTWSNAFRGTTQQGYLRTGLSPGSTRYFRVRNRDVDGWGPWSDVISGTTNPRTRPGTPTGVTTTVTASTITVSWTPADDGGSPITKYQIEGYEQDDQTLLSRRIFRTSTESDVTSYTATGLKASTTYNILIDAVNSIGSNTQSASVQVTTTAATKPGPPTGVITTVTASTITVSWTPADDGGSPITKYQIEGYEQDDQTLLSRRIFRTSTESDVTSYTATGLKASTTYNILIDAVNSIGSNTQSASVQATTTAATKPGPPTGLTATADGPTTINLEWTAPIETGGVPITGYEIRESSNGGSSWVQLLGNHDGTTYARTGLPASATRRYRIRASNARGSSGWTTSASVTTAAATTPGAPTGLRATADGPTTIDLSWNAPTNTGGAPITSYLIGVSTNQGSSWEVLKRNHVGTTYLHTGIPPSTRRDYRVYAFNSVGRSAVSSVANATTAAATAPSAPGSLKAMADEQTTINLSWTAPASTGGVAITGYRIEVSTNGGSTFSQLVARHSTTSYSHTGLSPRTTRHYRVRAMNVAGNSPYSNTADATTGGTAAPSAPRSLKAMADEQTRINLSWTAPSNNGGAAITGYRIEASTNGGTSFTNLVVNTGSAITSYSHTGLNASTTRHYRVRAINSVGPGAVSNTAKATTRAATKPSAPRSLMATADGQTTINLSWSAPSNTGGVAILGYRIEVSTNGGSDFSELVPIRSKTSYSHTGLHAATTRHYRVFAINTAGTSVASNTANATTAAATAPGAPTSLNAAADGQTTINLSWSAPSNTGGIAITGYRIEVSTDGGTSFTNLVANTGTTTTSFAHTGLRAEATRHYRIRAINSLGPGAPSNVDDATTDASTVTAPGPPTGLTATASGATIINLSWNAPTSNGGSAIIGYRIEVSATSAGTWSNLVSNTNSTATTYAHTNLSPATTRYYRVSAVNRVGAGAASTVVNATTGAATAPGAPTGLTATAAGQTTITLSWTAPTNNGGAAISGYRIEVSATGTGNWSDLEANTNSTATTYVHGNLSAETTQHYRVRAINSVAAGIASTVASATTDAVTVTAPDAPAGLRATASGRAVINLSWDAPTDNGGATISGYQIEVSDTGTGNWSDLEANTNSTATTYTHSNLSPATTQHYRVRAINSAGTSAASTTASATTDAVTAPDAPTSITASPGPTAITLSWTVPPDDGGSPITGYQIEVSEDAASTWAELTTSTQTTYVHTNLAPGTTRHYRVRAINAVGISSASTIVRATTDTPSVLSFAGAVEAQRYPVGLPLSDVVLPMAVGGVMPYTYVLSPQQLPEGLSFDEDTRTIGGTPTQVTEMQVLTWKVTDALGATAMMAFSLEVYRLTFATKVEDQSYPRGVLIAPLVLPEATGGVDPVDYTLTLLSLPRGLRFEPLMRVIGGTPTEISPPVEITYTATDVNGAQDSLKFTIEVVSPVATELAQGLPQTVIVHANYPNPFTSSTRILFDLPRAAQVEVDILDMTGRLVYEKPTGNFSPGTDQAVELTGMMLPAGVYLYRFIATSLEGSPSVHVGHLISMR